MTFNNNNEILYAIHNFSELSMRERQVTDLRLELDRVNNELTSTKQKYFEMKRALDADEARRLRVPSPATPATPLRDVT